jgi:hypothetical protein
MLDTRNEELKTREAMMQQERQLFARGLDIFAEPKKAFKLF